MRLWTLDPKYLDAKGLVASEREIKRARSQAASPVRSHKIPAPHPLFKIIAGEVRELEKMK